jgi:multiple sugar transport system ATP-binding protein
MGIDEAADMPAISARIRAVEMLGSELIVLVNVGGKSCAMRGARDLSVHAGDELLLTCRPADVHLFDAVSGRRLVRNLEPDAAVVGSRGRESSLVTQGAN